MRSVWPAGSSDETIFLQDFDGYIAMQNFIARAVDHPHAAFADFGHDAKVPEGFANHSRLLVAGMRTIIVDLRVLSAASGTEGGWLRFRSRYYNVIPMGHLPRHQCLIYSGAPSRQLPALSATMREKLRQNYRCLYLNSPPMVAGMGSSLWAIGVDVEAEMAKGALVLSSERAHLTDGRFDADRMMQLLASAFDEAMRAGFAGLWATGDMTWEMGSDTSFMKLVEYEWRLEKFFQQHPEMGGICQYHRDTLPRELLRQGLVVHPGIFVSETLQMVNPEHVRPEQFSPATLHVAGLDAAIDRVCRPSGGN